jgi:hypothetical protein
MEIFEKTEKRVGSESVKTFTASNVEFGRKPVAVKVKRKPCTGNCKKCNNVLC